MRRVNDAPVVVLVIVSACVLSGARAAAKTKVVNVKIRVDSQAPGYDGFRVVGELD